MTGQQLDISDLIGGRVRTGKYRLAVILKESGWAGSTLFLERRGATDWQPGMLLDGEILTIVRCETSLRRLTR